MGAVSDDRRPILGGPSRGLTLLEVVFAVVLVLLAAVFVMTLMAEGGRPLVKAQMTTTASMLAQSKMDVLMGTPFDSLVAESGKFPAPNDRYKFEVSLSALDSTVKRVRLTVVTPQGARLEMTALRAPPTEDVGQKKFQEYGCQACHAISKYTWATGTEGPNLDRMAEIAGTRVPGMSAETYLRESVRDPAAYVVDGYGPNMGGYPLTMMPEDDLDAVVTFMMTLK